MGRDEDFFALGGDSLRIVRLVSLASQRGVPLTVRDVLSHPTVAGLAQVARSSAPSSCLMSLREGVGSPALVLIPGSGGTLFAMGMLARSLPLSLPVFGLSTPPHASRQPMPSSLDALCTLYQRELAAGLRTQSLWLIGHSLGGVLALVLADRLRRSGWNVAGVILLDSWAESMENQPSESSLLAQLCMMLGIAVELSEWSALPTAVARQRTVSAVRNAGLGGTDPDAFVHALLESATGLQSLVHSLAIDAPPVPVHLIRADGGADDQPTSPRRGWTFPLQSVTPLPSTHFGMLRPPHLTDTAHAIDQIVSGKSRGGA